MHDGSFGPVLDPEDVSEEMLPEVGSRWADEYALRTRLVYRNVVVEEVSLSDRLSSPEQPVWSVRTREDGPWGRISTMQAHGFLSRFRRVD